MKHLIQWLQWSMGLADLSCFLPTTAWSQFGPNVRYKDLGQKQSSALPSKSKGGMGGGVGGVVLQNRGGKGKRNIKNFSEMYQNEQIRNSYSQNPIS